MSISTTVLCSLPFFEGLQETQLQELSSIATLRLFKPNAIVSRAGEVHDAVGYLLSGQLQTKEIADDGRVVSLSTLTPGAWVGWFALVDPRYVSDEVITVIDSHVITWPVRLLRPLVQGNVLLSNRFLQLATLHIQAAKRERVMLTLPNAFQRICFQINILAGQSDFHFDGAVNVLPKQHDLASAANTTRETVSRSIQILLKHGVIEKNGRRVFIRRRDLLRKLAYDGSDALQNSKHLSSVD